jgi:AAA domain
MSTQNLSNDTIFNAIDRERQELSRQQRQATLNHACELMRARGASEHAIQSALHGLHAFLQPSHAHHPRLPSSTPANSANDTAPAPTTTTPGRLLSEIETKPIQWLWPQRIPLGKLTLLEGEPGIGTSLLALTITAAVSSGQPLPGATPTPFQPEPCHVILISPQESASDTLKPRLQSAGADLSRVLLLNTIETLDAHNVTLYDRPFSLTHDLDTLEAAITRLNARLVIIDPFSLVLQPTGTSNAQRPTATSALLTRLAQLADRTACAFLLLRHIKTTRSTHAAQSPHPAHLRSYDNGLPGLVASMKNILLLIHHPDPEQHLVLLSVKHTLSPAPAALAFQIHPTPEDIPTLPCLGETHFLPEPTIDLSHLSVGRQAILNVLETSLHPLTPIEISHTTGQPNAAVRLLLKRMADSGEIGRPARGLYIAHHHRLASNTPTATDTPATPETIETFDTIATATPPNTPATFETSDTIITPPTLRRNHCKGGGGADAGRGPLRSPWTIGDHLPAHPIAESPLLSP